ncbi:MAG: guanylate kinase [Candidatus Aminicenantes bacterium]|jgi:guanylate kinase|nr:guanylate kinase [Candidatus Aminicenantes bacterium]
MKSKNPDRFNIIVISGPSGSGKSTLINRLVSEHRDIIFSVSHTTRAKRESEIYGKHYHFVSEEKFREMIAHNEFAEWAKVYQNFYGTSRDEIEQKSGNEKNLVLDLDVQGAANIKREFPSALFVFIVPPNLAELKKRLVAREKVIDSHIETRLKTAIKELKQYHLYDYTVINDKVEEAYAVLKSIYTAFNNSTYKKQKMIENILEGR